MTPLYKPKSIEKGFGEAKNFTPILQIGASVITVPNSACYYVKTKGLIHVVYNLRSMETYSLTGNLQLSLPVDGINDSANGHIIEAFSGNGVNSISISDHYKATLKNNKLFFVNNNTNNVLDHNFLCFDNSGSENTELTVTVTYLTTL